MPEALVLRSVAEVPAQWWDTCEPHLAEDHAYLRAVEQAALPGFTMRALVVTYGERLLAAAPAFVTRYPLDTMMEGTGARVIAGLRRGLPALLAPRLACLGSPCTETAGVRFARGLDTTTRCAAAASLVARLAMLGAEEDCALLGAKDLAADTAPEMVGALGAAGYLVTSGQPIAVLPIDFPDVEAYLASLSRATRRGLRRKLRSADAVRIERRTNIDDIVGRVHALYRATLDRAVHRFEELTPAYFTAVLAAMPGRAHVTLYYVGDELLAANLLVADAGILLDKYWCMADAGRVHGLYHLSWIENIRHCLQAGLTRYQAGQANANAKLSLGCRLEPTTTHVRHRNALCNGALRVALPWIGGEPVARAA